MPVTGDPLLSGVAGDGSLLTGVGGILTVAETEVFTGAAPLAWTDLDLSGTVGAQSTLVILKVAHTLAGPTIAVRKNGDTDEYFNDAAGIGAACTRSDVAANFHAILVVVTDASGIIEWMSAHNDITATIDVIAYIK